MSVSVLCSRNKQLIVWKYLTRFTDPAVASLSTVPSNASAWVFIQHNEEIPHLGGSVGSAESAENVLLISLLLHPAGYLVCSLRNYRWHARQSSGIESVRLRASAFAELVQKRHSFLRHLLFFLGLHHACLRVTQSNISLGTTYRTLLQAYFLSHTHTYIQTDPKKKISFYRKYEQYEQYAQTSHHMG